MGLPDCHHTVACGVYRAAVCELRTPS